MTTTRRFSSTDAGAPVLTGQNGSLISLLQACLVGTAGVAYGSGGTAKTAAGWSAPFTNTATKAVFRNSLAAGGSGCYCRVLDDGSIATAVAREAYMVTYQAMSDIDTGTSPAPATATLASGVVVRKSNTADSTARAWELVADERTWYLNIRANATVTTETNIYGSGDIASTVAGDAYRYFTMGRYVTNSTAASAAWTGTAAALTTPGSNGLYIGRNYASTGNSIPLALHPFFCFSSNVQGGSSCLADPAPGTSDRFFAPALLLAESTFRGVLRGIYTPANNLTAQAFGAALPGATGLPSGSSLVVFQTQASGTLAVEAALPWV